MRGQHLADRPRLAAVLGDDPAQLDRDPRQRNAPQRELHDPAVAREPAAREHDERRGEQEQEPDAEPDHDAERPEQRRHVRNRVVDGRADLLRRRVDDGRRVFLAAAARSRGRPHRSNSALASGERSPDFSRCSAAYAFMPFSIRASCSALRSLMPGDRRVERARGDQPHQPRDLDRVVRRFGLLVGKAEHRERRRRLLGLPFGLDRRQLHLLHLAGRVPGLVAEHDHRQRRGEPEAGRDGERAHRERRVAQVEQVVRRDARARTSIAAT